MTALPETKSVDLSLENGWLTVWFNQPERRNPLTDDVVNDLEIILSSVRDDRRVNEVKELNKAATKTLNTGVTTTTQGTENGTNTRRIGDGIKSL